MFSFFLYMFFFLALVVSKQCFVSWHSFFLHCLISCIAQYSFIVFVDFLVCSVTASLSAAASVVVAVVGALVTLHQRCLHTRLAVFEIFWIFFNVLPYTSATIRNSRTYKWYFQVRLYSCTLISLIYKCALIKCDYTATLINLK